MNKLKKKKLKLRVQELELRLHELVLRPESEKSKQIKWEVETAFELERAYWFGDSKIKAKEFEGLIKTGGL